MEAGLVVAVCAAFAFTNGIHNASHAIATLVATRAIGDTVVDVAERVDATVIKPG
jgi:phosphate/sulfate permease